MPAGVRAVSCEDAAQVAKIDQVRGHCPLLEHVVVFDGSAPAAVTLAELRARGAATGDAVVAERLAGVGPGDVATIVYTSGTTGPPKGCVITHFSLLATVAMYVRELELRDREMVIYLFLPLAHSLARVAQLATLEAGGTLAFWGGDAARIVDELAEVRPTHFPSVPRI
ncbi:MAG: AMP-binding protein [Solirubrobacteraceae bacterium]